MDNLLSNLESHQDLPSVGLTSTHHNLGTAPSTLPNMNVHVDGVKLLENLIPEFAQAYSYLAREDRDQRLTRFDMWNVFMFLANNVFNRN